MTTPSDPYGGNGEQPGAWPPPQQPYGPPPEHGQQPPAYQPPPPPPGQPPQYGQPAYGQPQYGQPQYGQPQYGQPQYGPNEPLPLVPPPGRKHRGKIVAAAAAVVVIGGGVATYAAVSSSNAAGGSGDPKSAVKTLVDDLNDSDLVGLLDDLPPGERDAINKPFQKVVKQLKRNDVLRPDADLNKVGGVQVRASDLTFAGETIDVNDHVRIVQLTGGKIAFNADLRKAPVTKDFLDAIGASRTTASQTVDIAQQAKENGRPLRIATQKVDGKWYPSLLYTIADNATTSSGLQAPSAADRIPARGASSPDAAVESFVTALLDADVERAAELLSPEELAVVHDYGKLILDRLHYEPTGAKIRKLDLKDSDGSGGTRVTLRSIELTLREGDAIKVSLDGDCATVTVQGDTRRMCAGQLMNQLAGLGQSATPAQQQALTHLFSGLSDAVGLVTTKVDGKWYVNPVRSYFEMADAMLSGLRGNDMQEIMKLGRN